MDAEHPIPQEVSTYQFKLVGDMTIQQFMQVAGGALVSLVIYSSNMAGYVKWPLIIVSFLIGVAFAFFPIEDRPLSKWLVLFIKAIYSPTVYVWNKNAVRHSFFAPENSPQMNQVANSVPVTQAPSSTLPEDQQTQQQTVQPPTESDKLENKEVEFLNKVNQQFMVRQTVPIPSTPTNISQQAEKKEISVPNAQKIEIEKKVDVSIPTNDVFNSKSDVGNQVSPSSVSQPINATAATFAPEAAPPSPPTMPNIIVGQTLDETGSIIDGAILEIKDEQGRSVRALRTNRLGHFMIVTPLANNKYQIVSEKDGFTFEPVSISLEGRVIPPIVIKGEKVASSI